MYPHTYTVQIDSNVSHATVDFPRRLGACARRRAVLSGAGANLYSNYSTEFIPGGTDNPCKGACNFQTVFAIVWTPARAAVMTGADLPHGDRHHGGRQSERRPQGSSQVHPQGHAVGHCHQRRVTQPCPPRSWSQAPSTSW